MGYLEQHLKKYPLMQIEDKIKLLMQASLGPSHLIKDKEKVKERIIEEYNQIKDIDYEYDMVEHISDKYVRIYLKPYYENFKSFDNLIEALCKSCDNVSDLYYFEKDLIRLKETETKENHTEEYALPTEPEEDEEEKTKETPPQKQKKRKASSISIRFRLFTRKVNRAFKSILNGTMTYVNNATKTEDEVNFDDTPTENK